MFLFGLHADEAEDLLRSGYSPSACYQNNPRLKGALDCLGAGLAGERFNDISLALLTHDVYLLLADFEDYERAHREADAAYRDPSRWSRMALLNIAGSGIFAADRAVEEYAKNIWNLEKAN
jgi:starch phosphorylase